MLARNHLFICCVIPFRLLLQGFRIPRCCRGAAGGLGSGECSKPGMSGPCDNLLPVTSHGIRVPEPSQRRRPRTTNSLLAPQFFLFHLYALDTVPRLPAASYPPWRRQPIVDPIRGITRLRRSSRGALCFVLLSFHVSCYWQYAETDGLTLFYSHNSKDRSEFLDPCQEAALRSIRCLNRNEGDRRMCSDYFQLVAERNL